MSEQTQPDDLSTLKDEIINSPRVTYEPKTLEEANVYHKATEVGRDMWDKYLALNNIHLAQRADKAENELNVDQKSKLATERKWKSDLENTVENLRDDQSLFVMVADVNGFKPVNDSLGHTAGDRLLGLIGVAFKEAFRRESDYIARGSREGSRTNKDGIARLGGDEFAVFEKREADEHEGHQRSIKAEEIVAAQSERLNSILKEILLGTEFEGFNISIALGGVEYDPTIDKSPLDAFVRADAAMYTKKYEGKIESIEPQDIEELRRIIPYMEGLGARVEPWLKEAAYKVTQQD